ncbi:MAG: histidine phosphatase family protein [Planctomycetota bacterium]
MPTIYVVTHTESKHHTERLVGGWYDASLTVRGKVQATAIADAIRRRVSAKPRLFCSDLRRAFQTAEPMAALLDCKIETTTDLREVSCGVAEGGPQAWLDENIVKPPIGEGRLDHRICEGAETRREAATRVYAFMQRLMDDLPLESVIVTHGFVATFVLSAWIGLPIEAAAHVSFPLDSGSITTLKLDETWGNRAVLSLGDINHLADGQ